ncbi:flavodoxin family protein [Chryseobacterium joostei]|uniref:Flavodoxin family protein n=1 Tax=Chryseobacterium joostei TaxID=112234 RepID=A0A1N7IYI6_9FLAO|nr:MULTISPECIES: NAD(P)H-dependent oxidoreductase [Chryseobacterium]AZB01439.1 flavodoxin family protein [Chryseobacterium joostei]SIS42129.1 glutathione-regulated potassium-efflux system ancillary protein KefG [Chryseobacterium joostei]HCM33033.1 NAD(P)H dehydrogenase [Chryseobacterium sp.]
MKKTLVVFAHPYLEHSNSNVELINFYVRHQHYTLRDLYEEYPDFHIAAFRERKRLANYERFVFQFPLIWFGMPPLLRLWIDEVFDRDWLQPGKVNPLENKEVYILVTTGGKERSFSKDGTYQYSVDELISGLIVSLKVFKADIKHIKIVYEANKLSKKDIILHKKEFTELLNQ